MLPGGIKAARAKKPLPLPLCDTPLEAVASAAEAPDDDDTGRPKNETVEQFIANNPQHEFRVIEEGEQANRYAFCGVCQKARTLQ